MKKKYRFHSLLHAADLVERDLRNELEPLGLRPRQARILSALNRMGPISQTTLAKEFQVTPGSMSTMVTRLEKLDLITRYREPDERRSDVLSLTAQGKAHLQGIRKSWKKADALIVTAIGAEKAQLLSELTSELTIELGGHVPGASMATKENQSAKGSNRKSR